MPVKGQNDVDVPEVPVAKTSCAIPSIEKSRAMWATKPELYLATGPYCSWRVDVDLCPPASFFGPPPLEDATFLQYYYNVLQYILYETGFPETIDETRVTVNGSARKAWNEMESTAQGERQSEDQLEDADNVTIVMLSNPIEIMGMLLEGGRQSPGNMLLVLSMSWVEKRRISSAKDRPTHRLYVHKAIAFMDSGRSALRVFNPPRRATYCLNFFTASCTGAMRNDGQYLEADLDCTMTSRRLCQLVDDKLWMRMLISERCRSTAIQIPRTLAFVYQAIRSYDLSKSGGSGAAPEAGEGTSSTTNGSNHDNSGINDHVTVINLSSTRDVADLMTSSIALFLNSPKMEPYDRVVVKPSGEMWMSCMGVTFHSRNDLDSITSAAERLLIELQPGDAILVEAFCETFRPRHDQGQGHGPGRRPVAGTNGCAAREASSNSMTSPCLTSQLSFSATDVNSCRFRATVSRGPDNKAHMSKLVCGVGYRNEPLNGDNTVGQSLDTTLAAFGVSDTSVRMRTHETLKSASEAVLTAIIEHENELSIDERGSLSAQTDLIGIDFVLTDDAATRAGENGSSVSSSSDIFRPIVIEVNSLNCTTNCDVYEFTCRQTSGEAFEMFIGNAIAVSQRSLAAGATVVVFGACSETVVNLAHRYCIHVIHLTEETDTERVSTVNCRYQQRDAFYSQLVYCSTQSLINAGSSTLHDNAEQLVRYLHQTLPPSTDINGVLSFDRRLVPISSTVARLLRLPADYSTSPSGAAIALDVAAAQRVLVTRNAAIPQWNASQLYSLFHGHKSSEDRRSSPCSRAARAWIEEQSSNETESRVTGVHGFALSSFTSLKSMVEAVRQVHRVDVIVERRKLLGGVVSDYVLVVVSPASSSSTASNGRQDRIDIRSSTAVGDALSSSVEQAAYRSTDDGCSTMVNSRWPTALPDDKRDQLVIAAYQCCNELDLVTGVFTVEMTFDVVSPKMIRVIPCIDLAGDDGDELSVRVKFYDRLLADSGVDLVLYALLLACRHGRPQPALPVRWSYQNHLGCRRTNCGLPKQLSDLDRMIDSIGNIPWPSALKLA